MSLRLPTLAPHRPALDNGTPALLSLTSANHAMYVHYNLSCASQMGGVLPGLPANVEMALWRHSWPWQEVLFHFPDSQVLFKFCFFKLTRFRFFICSINTT